MIFWIDTINWIDFFIFYISMLYMLDLNLLALFEMSQFLTLSYTFYICYIDYYEIWGFLFIRTQDTIHKKPPLLDQGGAVKSLYLSLPWYWDWQSFGLRPSKAEGGGVYERCAEFFCVGSGVFFTVGANSSNQFKYNDLFMSNLSGVRLNKSHR